MSSTSVADVLRLLESPEEVHEGQTAVEYDGFVNGRPLHLVVVKGSEPPLVITVYERDR